MTMPMRLKAFLDENRIQYNVITHSPTYSSQIAAATMHVSGKELVKTVVLRGGRDTYIAVLPASCHVSLDKFGALVGKAVRLATEPELASLFPDCELGAMPPFGQLYHLPVYMDEALAADEEIVFNAGTHQDAIRMRYADFARLVKPQACFFTEKG